MVEDIDESLGQTLKGLSFEQLNKLGIGVGQHECQMVPFKVGPPFVEPGFSEVDLSFSGRMIQRQGDLFALDQFHP